MTVSSLRSCLFSSLNTSSLLHWVCSNYLRRDEGERETEGDGDGWKVLGEQIRWSDVFVENEHCAREECNEERKMYIIQKT